MFIPWGLVALVDFQIKQCLDWCLWEGHYEIQLPSFPLQNDGEKEEKVNDRPCNYWGVAILGVLTIHLLASMYVEMCFPLVNLLESNSSFASHGPH